MKVIVKVFVLTCLIGLLTACSSVTDMLDFSDDNNGNNDTHVIENNGENINADVENDNELNANNNESETTEANNNNESEAAEADNDDETNESASMRNECEDESEKILEKMNADFFITDCATVTSTSKIDDGFKAKLAIEGAEWEAVLDEYMDAFPDQIEKDDKEFDRETGIIRIEFDEKHTMQIMSSQYDDYVEVRLTYKDKS